MFIFPIYMRKSLYLVQIGVLLISYAIFLFTVSPTVYWNDSGEIITAVYSLGMAHSPSFPIYILLAKLITFLPFGSIAFKVNLISVIFGCLTILFLFKIIYFILGMSRITIRSQEEKGELESSFSDNFLRCVFPAITASCMLAFTHAFWIQSVRAEVYTLNIFLAALIIHFLLRWNQDREGEEKNSGKGEVFLLYLVSFVIGLSVCNHSLLTIYLAPGILFIIIKNHLNCILTPRVIVVSSFFLLLGLSLYLYLPIRSINNPIMDWNNPETMERFLNAFSRKRELDKFFTHSNPLERLQVYAFMMIKQFTFFFYWVGIVGIWRLFKKGLSIAILTTLVFLFNMLGTVSSSNLSTQNPDILGYLTISYFIYTIWVGVGLKFLIDLLLFRTKTYSHKKPHGLYLRARQGKTRLRLPFRFTPKNDMITTWDKKRRMRVCVSIFVQTLIILSPLVLFFVHFDHSNKSNHYFARDFGMRIMKSIEDNSILFLKHDNVAFSTIYLINCERYREDIRLFDQNGWRDPMLIEPKRALYTGLWMPGIKQLRNIQKQYVPATIFSDVDKSGTSRPLGSLKIMEYLVFKNILNCNIYWESGEYDSIVDDYVVPNGLIFRVSESEDTELTAAMLKKHYQFCGLNDTSLLSDKRFLSDGNATKAYAIFWERVGNFFRKRSMFQNAVNHLEYSKILFPNKPDIINNLGFCYLQMGRLDEAEREFLTVLKLFGYYAEAHVNLGVVYARKGDYQKAKREWEMVLERNPESAIAKENLKKLRVKSEKLRVKSQ
ncbi:MAG: DUF2723 domain-containing protein [Thermodesulfobacteriota bacterium]|nr:DUF2723 domain-containing protein [Thermodesulfobacteriota bacterium]